MHDVLVPDSKRTVWQRFDDHDLPWQRPQPLVQKLATIGRVAVVVFFALMSVVMMALTVVAWHDERAPVHWGTFTETSTTCDGWGRSRHCTIVGNWVSDDGHTTLTAVTLDGSIDPGQSVLAGYRDEGTINSDLGNNVVHTKSLIDSGPWVGLLGAAMAGFFGASYWHQRNGGWRLPRRSEPEYRPRHGSATD